MTLAEAASVYVTIRRSAGSPFVSSERTIRSFCEFCGNIALSEVTSEKVSSFLNDRELSQITRVSKYSALKCFIAFCEDRCMLPALTLVKPAAPKSSRLPFVYTRMQIQSLLKGAVRCRAKKPQLSGATFRMSLLLLYATAGSVAEVLSLNRSDVNLKMKCITIRGTGSRPGRTIPIGEQLRAELAFFLQPEGPRPHGSALLLPGTSGQSQGRSNLRDRFERLLIKVGIGSSAPGRSPRLQDLRYSFAVHRIANWIEAGVDLNEMLPALSTYMGYASLTAAERFLVFVPERFQKDVEKLCPNRTEAGWRNAPELLSFLTKL